MSGVGVGVGIGAGVGVSSVALAPFNAANTFMGSAFFGYGMILGERYAYQADWPKIQARLENGEKIENIIQEYTGRFTAVVMKEAKIIFTSVTQEFADIITDAIKKALQAPFTGPLIDPNAPTIGDPRRKPFVPPTTVPKPVFDPNNPVVPVIPKPVPRPPRQKPEPTKQITTITIPFLESNAQGRLIFRNTNKGNQWVLETKFGGFWNKIASLGTNVNQGISLATATWPQSGYNQYRMTGKTLGRQNSRLTYYWVLKFKL